MGDGGDCIRAEHRMVLGAGPRWLIWGSGETDGVVRKEGRAANGLQVASGRSVGDEWVIATSPCLVCSFNPSNDRNRI